MCFARFFKKEDGVACFMVPCTVAGLAQYAHLINVDFFNDLLAVLDSALATKKLSFEDSLNCVSAAFQICSGQGTAV